MKLWSVLWLRMPTQSSRPAAPSSVRAQSATIGRPASSRLVQLTPTVSAPASNS
jgi:hypothetical protein